VFNSGAAIHPTEVAHFFYNPQSPRLISNNRIQIIFLLRVAPGRAKERRNAVLVYNILQANFSCACHAKQARREIRREQNIGR